MNATKGRRGAGGRTAALALAVLAGALLCAAPPGLFCGCKPAQSPAAQAPDAGAGLRVEQDPAHPGRFTARFETMSTEGAILVCAPGEAQARRMIAAALEPIHTVAAQMSTYRADSEVSRLNRDGSSGPVALSQGTMRVLDESVNYTKLTGGAFDVTYAPLRTLWRAAQQEGRMPSQADIARALDAVGYYKLVLTYAEDGGGTASFAAPGMEVDLGGIAKGYAVDLAAEALIAAGAPSALVEIGGDMRAVGRREEWKIRVYDPRLDEHEPMFLRLSDAAVATSGDYARYFEVAGRRLSHVIDPRTGLPVEGMSSVTVVAPTATDADALSTAVSVMGPAEGLRLVDSRPGVECMIMLRPAGEPGGGEEAVQVVFSKGFLALTEGGAER